MRKTINIRNYGALVLMLLLCWFLNSANASTWYVDGTATGSRNGTSWTNAWASLNNVTGVSAGDTVYISGGPSNATQTYNLAGSWMPTGGAAGNPTTYKIGQDSSHNGMAIFKMSSAGNDFISGAVHNVIVSGDAGDGQMHFQLSNIAHALNAGGSTNFRFSYVNCGQTSAGGFQLNGVGHLEVDHCYCYKTYASSNDDHMCYIGDDGGGTTWDYNKLHDNTFYVPRNNGGDGDDCIQGLGNGLSLYNNTIIGYYLASYGGYQHQDGCQPLQGNWIKVYGNYIQDMANFGTFADAYYGDFNHYWVYNNIVVLSVSVLAGPNSACQGIVAGPDGGALAQMGRYPVFNDCMECNNLVVDFGNHSPINLSNPPGAGIHSTFPNCLVANNITINCPDGIRTENSSDGVVPTKTNSEVTLADGTGHFVSYMPFRAVPSNDFHLLPSDTTFKGQGTNLSSYFTTDKDGNPRPASGGWSIGPYESASGTKPPAAPTGLRIAPTR